MADIPTERRPARRARTGAGGSPARIDPIEAAYSILAFTMNRCVIDQMLRSSRRFGGDYERLILWGVLAHLNVAPLMPPGSPPSAVLDARGSVPGAADRLHAVRASDLAQITGIPRETVRRKLRSLERDGWIVQETTGWAISIGTTETELRDFTMQSIRNFLQAAQAMEAAIDDAATGRVSGSRTARSVEVRSPARKAGARRNPPPPRRD